MDWEQARKAAVAAAPALRACRAPVTEGVGRVLAAPIVAPVALPRADTSAMDGWATCGDWPWLLCGDVRAGQLGAPLAAGQASAVATGTWLPVGSEAVLRSEHGCVEDGLLRPIAGSPRRGADIRPAGVEAPAGEQLVTAGRLVTPAVVGLACAAGVDELVVTRRPRVTVLVLGDELLSRGLPRDGRVRDALGPMLLGWLAALGAEVLAIERVGDDADALAAAVERAGGDLVITTGGTAAGPVDHVHGVLSRLGAALLVDGVDVRPGHPMLLAALPDGRHHIGLPGNPLAAVSGLLTLVEPFLRACTGRPVSCGSVELAVDVAAHPADTRLVPLRAGRPSTHAGPAMLRGLADAEVVAVVPAGGAHAGDRVLALPLPWTPPEPPG